MSDSLGLEPKHGLRVRMAEHLCSQGAKSCETNTGQHKSRSSKCIPARCTVMGSPSPLACSSTGMKSTKLTCSAGGPTE